MTRLLHWSDLHFGAEVPAAVEALVAVAGDLEPDGILIGGDFTMRSRHREWAKAKAFLGRLRAPVLAIPGNHDIPAFNDPWDRFFHPFQRYRQAVSHDLEPSSVIGDVEVYGLNTARRFGAPSLDWSHGAVSIAQCLTLPSRFEHESPLRAVIIHHPLTAPPGHRRKLLRRDGLLLAALEEAKVDLLLAGHFHMSHVGLLKLPLGTRDIVLSHVSTACSWRTKGEPMGFHSIDASPGSINVARYDYDERSSRFVPAGKSCFLERDGSWRGADEEVR